jgi:uncharacterized FlaG/YvyC family protein
MNVNGVGSGVPSIHPASSVSSTAPQVNATVGAAAARDVALPVGGAVAGDAPSPEHIKQVVQRANELLEDLQSSMRLEYKVEDLQAQVTLVDEKTGTAIRTFPASAFLQIVHRSFVGLLMDSRA